MGAGIIQPCAYCGAETSTSGQRGWIVAMLDDSPDVRTCGSGPCVRKAMAAQRDSRILRRGQRY